MAKRIRKTERAGKGAMVQTLGILIAILFWVYGGINGGWVGVLIAVVALVVGSVMASVWKCGACLNLLADKEVRVCPVCKTTLE